MAASIRSNKEYKTGTIIHVTNSFRLGEFWEKFCTREQFEAFVESIFEGAPEGTTHKGKDGLFYKLGAASAHCLNYYNKWALDANGKDWLSKNLIPRPAKKAEPKAPWVPKVGEECEAIWRGTGEWEKVIYVGDFLFFEIAKHSYAKFNLSRLENLQFRPLRTERELFIEQATKDYLDQVGSDAVNEKWFGRIFGALYDKKYRKEAAQ